MNIVFLGAGAFGLPALEAITASAHRVVGVVSQPDRPAGRGRRITPTAVSAFARAHALPLLTTEEANGPDAHAQVLAWQPDCLVVIAFGQKLSDATLQLAPHGGINLHASLLPKYRGAAPINWAIINGEAQSGVTVIRVTNIMDGGAILATASTPIAPDETAGVLHDRLALLGAPLVPAVLDMLERGEARELPQDHAAKCRAPKLSRADAWIDFRQDARQVSARIRGLSPWPGCSARLLNADGQERVAFTILRCIAVAPAAKNPQPGSVLHDRTIACATGALQLLDVQPIGGKPMDAAAFANGYGLQPHWQVQSILPPPAGKS